MFSNEINGYNKKEVNKKINDMLKEMANIKQKLHEKDKLNLGLANALEKSKEIEASAKNLFELKLQKISYVYKNLEKTLQNLFRSYPQIAELSDIKTALDDFATVVINSVVKKDYAKKTINEAVNTENDTIRLLLNKMSAYSQPPTQQPQQESHKVSIKRVPPTKPQHDINRKQTLNNLYPTPNESGFDLKEAINPKDDLYEIMKAFNLDE